tara:strand:- start:7283 stop:7933 length:651 start_codon:yes stop_codon:yes gene_type:complete
MIELRGLLRERFPEAHRIKPEEEVRDPLETGIRALDQIGVGQRQITEIVSPGESRGAGLVFASLLRKMASQSRYLALIDARDSFDPQSLGVEACRWLFWVRCREIGNAMKAADWLLRDGNLPHVVLDLQQTPVREIRRLPSSGWHRLRALVEQTGTTLVVQTPERTIPSAHLRVTLEQDFGLDALDALQSELERNVEANVARARFDAETWDGRMSA